MCRAMQSSPAVTRALVPIPPRSASAKSTISAMAKMTAATMASMPAPFAGLSRQPGYPPSPPFKPLTGVASENAGKLVRGLRDVGAAVERAGAGVGVAVLRPERQHAEVHRPGEHDQF